MCRTVFTERIVGALSFEESETSTSFRLTSMEEAAMEPCHQGSHHEGLDNAEHTYKS